MSTKLSYDSVKLLISNTFYMGGRTVFQVFMNIFLWKETQDLKIIALFNISFLVFHLFGFVLIARFVKQGYGKIVNSISFLGFIILYIFLTIFGEIILIYPYVCAGIYGFFNGIYYSNYNIQQFRLTRFLNRGNFEGLKKVYKVVGKVVFPGTIGLIVGVYNIQMALIFGILIFVISWLFGKNTGSEGIGELEYRELFMRMKNDMRFFFSLGALFFFAAGFSMSLIDVLIPLIIYDNTLSEVKLGFSLSLLSIGSVIFMYLFGRFVQYKYYRYILPLICVLFAGSLFLILGIKDQTSAILYGAIITSLITLFSIPGGVISTNVLHIIPDYKKFIVEHIVFREIALTFGWILSFGMMYFAKDFSAGGLDIVFYSMIICSILCTIMFMKVRMHEIKE